MVAGPASAPEQLPESAAQDPFASSSGFAPSLLPLAPAAFQPAPGSPLQPAAAASEYGEGFEAGEPWDASADNILGTSPDSFGDFAEPEEGNGWHMPNGGTDLESSPAMHAEHSDTGRICSSTPHLASRLTFSYAATDA